MLRFQHSGKTLLRQELQRFFGLFLDLVVSAMLLSFLNHLVELACRSLCSKTVLASSLFSVSTRVLIVLVSAATLSFLCQILRSFLCRPSLNQHLFDGDRVVDEFLLRSRRVLAVILFLGALGFLFFPITQPQRFEQKEQQQLFRLHD